MKRFCVVAPFVVGTVLAGALIGYGAEGELTHACCGAGLGLLAVVIVSGLNVLFEKL